MQKITITEFVNKANGYHYGLVGYGGSRRNNCVLKTQEQLAKEMDMDVRTLQNYKILADMIPELDDLVDTGIVTLVNVWMILY
ncbi:MAG: hypothetical protein HFI06_11935 [Eubacterium sp.]|jgi:hypothetical protein|nr:hypothetical protein [Eubacterium sp.]